jgi:aspartate ammonia-lyase
MIENPNTVDAQSLMRAKHDLESFIQLSGLIKKDADKLNKEKQ